MKKSIVCVAALLVLLGFAQTASAQTEQNAAGAWAFTIDAGQGPMVINVTLTAEGPKVAGTMQGPAGEVPMTGTLTGDKIKLAATINFGGMPFAITFEGTIDKDKISGMADFGGFGGGTFTAERKK